MIASFISAIYNIYINEIDVSCWAFIALLWIIHSYQLENKYETIR